MLGNLADFDADPLGFLTRCAREYGDVVRLGEGNYLLCHPRDIEHVFTLTQRGFVKRRHVHREQRAVPGIFSEAMMNTEGEDWLRKRRILQPAFHREKVEAAGEVIVTAAEAMRARWRPGEVRDVGQDMMGLSLDIISRLFLGGSLLHEARRIAAAVDALMQRLISPFRIPFWVPTPGHLRYRRAMKALDALLYELIARHRAGELRSEMLELFLAARDEPNRLGTDWHLRDELAMMIMSGHETTADAYAWTWYLLAQHPAEEARLHAELDAVLEGRRASTADAARLPYTTAVIKESLRLYPPGWMTHREVVADCEVGGYAIPEGTTLAISQWVTHRDARFFAEPETFRPERWLDGSLEGLPRYAFFPFGGGPRVCIGASLSMLELVLGMATLARDFRMELAPGARVTPMPSLALRPEGVRMVLHAREPARARAANG